MFDRDGAVVASVIRAGRKHTLTKAMLQSGNKLRVGGFEPNPLDILLRAARFKKTWNIHQRFYYTDCTGDLQMMKRIYSEYITNVCLRPTNATKEV
jgi:hypothetical protein